MDEILAEIHGLIDFDSAAFKSDNYLELAATIEKNKSQLPDLKVVDGYAYKRMIPYNGEPIGEDFAWKLGSYGVNHRPYSEGTYPNPSIRRKFCRNTKTP